MAGMEERGMGSILGTAGYGRGIGVGSAGGRQLAAMGLFEAQAPSMCVTNRGL